MRRLRSSRFTSALSQLRRSERGIALPMAMLITVVAMGFAAVPIVASINSQNGGSHNQAGNQALAAAEAGAEIAVLHQSQLLAGEEDSASGCTDGKGIINESGWCEPVTSAEVAANTETPEFGGTGGGVGYSFQVRPCWAPGVSCDADVSADSQCAEEGTEVQVVATGTATVGGLPVSKRIEVRACPSAQADPGSGGGEPEPWETELIDHETKVTEKIVLREQLKETIKKEEEEGKGVEYVTGEEVTVPPPNIYAAGQIVGVEWLNMNNNAQVYNGGAGSNGWVSMVGSANVCGTVSYGTTFTTDNSSSNKAPSNCAAGRKAGKGTAEYPSAPFPVDITTNNSDSRLAAEDPVGANVWQRGNISWNAANRFLTVNYDELKLEGTKPYYLCKLVLAGGSKLRAGTGKTIKIYFDAPENCPGLNGSPQLEIANGTYVGADASHGPEFIFAGPTGTGTSKVVLGGGAEVSQFFVYAPKSTVVAANGVNVNGVIIGKTLELAGGASINRSGAFTGPPVETIIPTTKKPGEPKPQESKTIREHRQQLTQVESEISAEETEVLRIRTAHGITGPPTGPGGGTVLGSLHRELFIECSSQPTGLTEADPQLGCSEGEQS